MREAECGWNVKAGDAEGLAKLVIELSQTDEELLKEKGMNGKIFYEENFTMSGSLKKLDEIMGLK